MHLFSPAVQLAGEVSDHGRFSVLDVFLQLLVRSHSFEQRLQTRVAEKQISQLCRHKRLDDAERVDVSVRHLNMNKNKHVKLESVTHCRYLRTLSHLISGKIRPLAELLAQLFREFRDRLFEFLLLLSLVNPPIGESC